MRSTTWAARALCALVCVAAFAAPGAAQAPADYTGKRVTIVIGYGVGGTYDQYAQLFSRHLGEFLPGHPTTVVQTMPGAGGVKMLNEAATRAIADGTMIFIPPDTMVTTQLLDASGNFYDARRFQYSAPPTSRTSSGWCAKARCAASPT